MPLLDPGKNMFNLYENVKQKKPLWDPSKTCFILYRQVKQKNAFWTQANNASFYMKAWSKRCIFGCPPPPPNHGVLFIWNLKQIYLSEWCQTKTRQTLSGRVKHHSPDATHHSFAVRSSEAMSTKPPSGEKAARCPLLGAPPVCEALAGLRAPQFRRAVHFI